MVELTKGVSKFSTKKFMRNFFGKSYAEMGVKLTPKIVFKKCVDVAKNLKS